MFMWRYSIRIGLLVYPVEPLLLFVLAHDLGPTMASQDFTLYSPLLVRIIATHFLSI